MTKPRDNFGLVVVGGDLYAVGGHLSAIGSQVGRKHTDDDDDYDDENIDDNEENYLLHFCVTNKSESKGETIHYVKLSALHNM